MSYDSARAASAIREINAGTASDAVHMDLEMYLLDLVKAGGYRAVLRELQGQKGLDRVSFESTEPFFTRVVCTIGDRRVVIRVYENEDLISVDVSPEESAAAKAETDPRHEWFYGRWETMLDISEQGQVDKLSESDRSVYLIALLEAEVMNGGLGQYLTNTDGLHVDETIEMLQQIGAKTTASLLTRARSLKGERETYADMWDTKAKALEALDDDFLKANEDLAGLVGEMYKTA